MEIARFMSLILRVGMALALMGQLKSCTLELMGLAAEKNESWRLKMVNEINVIKTIFIDLISV